jgi:hypothetical protein
LGTATASSAKSPSGSNTCAGGPIAPGTYQSLTVTGFCSIGAGVVNVKGGLTIAPNAGLDAQSDCDAHLNVSGGISVLDNAILFLGNSVNGTGCPADSGNVIQGGLRGTNAIGVVVHGTSISGGFSLQGGGGGNSYGLVPNDNPPPDEIEGCLNLPGLPFPPFSDVEDSQINGGASMSGLTTCWMGFIRNQVNGVVTVNNNTLGDPDAIEIGLNTIHGTLACSGNQRDPASPILPLGVGGVPTNSFDGSPPNPNTVTGQTTGQCAGL